MEICGWGRYPKIESDTYTPISPNQCAAALRRAQSLIARGLGRSYGDSSLAQHVLDSRYLDHLHAFENTTGLLTCSGGVSLEEILRVFVPKGWFLPVTPGTRYVTVGGAIASDVHGKNHHVNGSFTDHVTEIELLLGNGETVRTSPASIPELFHATCGGMGLTGIILSAKLRLKPIRCSTIVETTIKSANLDAVMDAFAEHAGTTYSVAWIDCLARGKHLGRSLLMLGEHAEDGMLTLQDKKPIQIPCDMPSALLNHATVKAFNAFYYCKTLLPKQTRLIPFERFFYPLDTLAHWNRLYGKQGFVQYQFVLPITAGINGLRSMVERIAAAGLGAFLAVLKVFGKGNQHYLSFPIEGYTLALDFKAEPVAFQLMDELDKIVLDLGGRLYLAKDARMSEATFKTSYPRWHEFEEVRHTYHAIGKFASLQSRRLGLQ
jgi:FAD/FMN-containing dehydrogenase